MQCPECARASNQRSKIYFVERVSKVGAYVHTCDAKHKFSAILSNPLHEVLFESGVIALLLGFNREALTSFHVALERYLKFATNVMLRYRDVDEKEIEALGRDAKQSERAVGAFLSAYLLTFKRSFGEAKTVNKLSELRNEVVHNGEIPSEKNVMRHGGDIYRIVHSVNEELIAETKDVAMRALEWAGATGAADEIAKATTSPTWSRRELMALTYWRLDASGSLPSDTNPTPALADYFNLKKSLLRMYGGLPTVDLGPPTFGERQAAPSFRAEVQAIFERLCAAVTVHNSKVATSAAYSMPSTIYSEWRTEGDGALIVEALCEDENVYTFKVVDGLAQRITDAMHYLEIPNNWFR